MSRDTLALASIPSLRAELLFEARPRALLDLRTPAEFALDHVPGAHNVPLFEDTERAIVGTLYSRVSRDAAFEEGRRFARERIAALVDEVARAADWHPEEADLRARLERWTADGIDRFERELTTRPAGDVSRPVVLYCWRGGLRSKSVVCFVRSLGLEDAVVLEGGYKAYRRTVIDDLETWSGPEALVMRGLTGVGKTLVLRELERIRPRWTLDLEGCAAHRSSILGGVGLEPRSQRAFESQLHSRLRAGFPGPLVIEGESRKVGDSILPLRIWEALDSSTNLRLTAPTARRVEVLMEDYLATPESRDELRTRLPFIEGRLGKSFEGELVALLDSSRERELAEVLLREYYDPLYLHSEKGRSYAGSIDSTDPARAAAEIAAWIEARSSTDEGPDPVR